MPRPTAAQLPTFKGLDLRDDPQEVGLGAAIDGLNFDVFTPGRLRARDGYAKFTAAAAANVYSVLQPFYVQASSITQLVAVRGVSAYLPTDVDVLSTSGAVVASQTGNFLSLVRFGTPTASYVYAIANGGGVKRWDGSGWGASTARGGVSACVQPNDNRLVVVSGDTIRFSDAGDPETFGTNNFVTLTPGDGEQLQMVVAYGDYVMAFKNTKFFVFYGNASDGSGNPIFNYRPVVAGVGCVNFKSAVTTPSGVFFVDRTGVYVTTGGTPQKISAALDPIFQRGVLNPYFQGSAINWTGSEWRNPSISYFSGRVYLSVETGSTTTGNDRTFVYDLESKQWTAWDLKANSIVSFRIADVEEMVFSLSSGTNDVCRLGPNYTTDAGTSIAARYRTGFWNPGEAGTESWVREMILDGTGTVTVKTSTNDGTALSTGQAVTLGTPPAIANGRARNAVTRSRNVSYEFSGTAPWSVSQAVPIVWGQRVPGEKDA